MPKEFVGGFEVLIDGDLALVHVQEITLEDFGGIAIGAGLPHRAVYQNRGGKTPLNVGKEVNGSVGGVRRSVGHAGFVEEGLSGHGLRRVGVVEIGHQFEERVVSDAATKGIEKEQTLHFLKADAAGGVDGL